MQEAKTAIFQMRFPQKLWYLLNLNTDAILWSTTGRTILLNYRILQKYLQCEHSIFKTTNISSFVRQLNLYGFRKVTSHLQDLLCNSRNPYMHEYVHDYFQYGRPELINKISRKVITLKRSFKSKCLDNNIDQMIYITPLQKARRALRMALKKAAQDLFVQNSAKHLNNLRFEGEDSQDECCEDEENNELDWLIPNSDPNAGRHFPTPENTDYEGNGYKTESDKYEQSQESLMKLSDEACQQNSYGFPEQFFSMPDLDPEPSNSNYNVELLAEFDINQDADTGIVKKTGEQGSNSLNCVLPSISNDQNDDVTTDKTDVCSNHFNGEWDQMFNDLIINRAPNQECGTDLKELYSQISKTIDLLNS